MTVELAAQSAGQINRHKLVSVLTYFRSTDYLCSVYVVPTKRKNGYSPSSRYFPIHSNEKTNKRLDKTRINGNFAQYSFLFLVRHFVCFEK